MKGSSISNFIFKSERNLKLQCLPTVRNEKINLEKKPNITQIKIPLL